MGLKTPSAGQWVHMFGEVAEQLPQAVLLTDMQVPGLPVTWCNSAFVALTGHPREWVLGRNCRFLQGPGSEADGVRKMVMSLRAAKATTLHVTNYRKDGSSFVNLLTLSPVHDNEGAYRFVIGVLSDASVEEADGKPPHGEIGTGAARERLVGALPRTMRAESQPKRVGESAYAVDEEAAQQQRDKYRKETIKFTRLLWSLEWEASLKQLLVEPTAVAAYGSWLSSESEYADDMGKLQLVVVAGQVAQQAEDVASQNALQICQRLIGLSILDKREALEAMHRHASQAVSALATESFPKFVASKACTPLIEQLLSSKAAESGALMWSKYKVPQDCAGWLCSFVAVAETFPACIVISDQTKPGNPMFFVNREFCRITEYSKTEATGRNCRFLQGPMTESQSVAVIQDTLRRGVDCHVKITNYRKSGSIFENLLTMRPVHDSNGVYRFCIGVQFEIKKDEALKGRLAKLDKLIKLLPKTIEVASRRAGEAHVREEVAVEESTALEVKLQSALEGQTVGPQLAAASEGGYDINRKEMLEHLGEEAESGPLQTALQRGAPHWKVLRLLAERSESIYSAARKQAALKLIGNHEAVLKDTTNPTALNIAGKPLTQPELRRVPIEQAVHVDEALREVAYRLLEEKLDDTACPGQAGTWAAMAAYVSTRIQSSRDEVAGREPDMSGAAAEAMRAVLKEVGAGVGDDVAAEAHPFAAREEAARKLLSNFDALMKDVTNPSPVLNIVGRALTQPELKRVLVISEGPLDSRWRWVAQGLLEVARRLIKGTHSASTDAATATWTNTAAYLDSRIQSTRNDVPGREPDMSAAAAAAMRAVLKEVGGMCGMGDGKSVDASGGTAAAGPLQTALQRGAPHWKVLRLLAERSESIYSAARKQAALKLIGNHEAVLKDTTNPTALNIAGKPLTQPELRRVPIEQAVHVDEALREVAYRLLEEKLDDTACPGQAGTWAAMAAYVSTRIQSSRDEVAGREPDMSGAAAEAMRAVLKEVGAGVGDDVAAEAHPFAAREEAARKLLSNFDALMKDVTNPSPVLNIVGRALTQPELKRVLVISEGPLDSRWRWVAQGLLEVARRLTKTTLDPSPGAQEARAAMCAYLDRRIQATPDDMRGRTPDMSAVAAEAMRAVLKEVGGTGTGQHAPEPSFEAQS